MRGVDKRAGKHLMRDVRALLMDWDALGVAGDPEAADEYDWMIGPLVGHLQRGADAAFLGEWIARECSDHLGIDRHTGADRALAEALVAWWHDVVPRR
jgi:hypothetical protein